MHYGGRPSEPRDDPCGMLRQAAANGEFGLHGLKLACVVHLYALRGRLCELVVPLFGLFPWRYLNNFWITPAFAAQNVFAWFLLAFSRHYLAFLAMILALLATTCFLAALRTVRSSLRLAARPLTCLIGWSPNSRRPLAESTGFTILRPSLSATPCRRYLAITGTADKH